MITVWNVIRALAGEPTGRACRTCSEPISDADRFGMSEGVCSPCRRASDTRRTPLKLVEADRDHAPAAEAHLRIMVEQMVREGHSERAIETAVRRAA
jgi:hypothetical protein